MTTRQPPADAAERAAAVAARTNVIVDAGAGTGKTTLLVDRLVSLVAPASDGCPALRLDRIAAVTFTRKAAGELKLRVRERLLVELGHAGLTAARRERLLGALAVADTAFIGTIHSFADRLLRLRPVEANLSPSYEVVDDEQELVAETTEILVRSAQEGTLASQLAGTGCEAGAGEAAEAILVALRSGMRAQTRFRFPAPPLHGLDALVGGFVQRRDTPPQLPAPRDFDHARFRAAAGEFIDRAASSAGGVSSGERWASRGSRTLQRALDERDPAVIASALQYFFRKKGDLPRMKDCGDNDDTWELVKAYVGDEDVRAVPLRDDILAPLDEWRAARLVRIFPVVIALYEKVKARRRTADQLDLLLRLRDMLRDDLAARAYYQELFDHIFVDEFQDTDPLQVQILLYLCEREARAAAWDQVELAPGKLTIVGDPKQSIYRFRRADVAMYEDARRRVAASDHREVHLTTNFRSAASLIEWINDRFDRILGVAAGGAPFDPVSGTVCNERLVAAAAEPEQPRVRVLPIGASAGAKVDELRATEGEAVARYVRHLVEVERLEITDPVTRERRPVRFGDIAILAVSTFSLDPLLRALDEMGVPHATRGGRLFLEDPLHQQFLLALRAISDPDDGIAQSALLRPPFFAVDPLDLLEERAARRAQSPPTPGARRAADAIALIRELRFGRHARPVGATARDLIDRTALARTIALGANAAQRLTRLRELCLLAERTASANALDFDATTARLRAWIDAPVQLDPPTPLAGEALQVITVHQAKGLEYPVVILWDGRCQWDTHDEPAPWSVTRDGASWFVDLDGLVWEHPRNAGLRDREQALRDAERRRLIYVAATRARELLVLPRAGKQTDKIICATLLAEPPPGLARELDIYVKDVGAPWSAAVTAPARRVPELAGGPDPLTTTTWPAAAAHAARPRFRPIAITTAARSSVLTAAADSPPADEPDAAAPATEDPDAATRPRGRRRDSRFGSLFGTTVHRALGTALRHPDRAIADIVAREAAVLGLTDHLDDAVADVDRTLATLASLGLRRRPGPTLRLEYPLAAPGPGDTLLLGFVDLVATDDETLYLLDFKTDAIPAAGQPVPPAYATQVQTYADVLARSLRTRAGLLYTADGGVRWCNAPPPPTT